MQYIVWLFKYYKFKEHRNDICLYKKKVLFEYPTPDGIHPIVVKFILISWQRETKICVFFFTKYFPLETTIRNRRIRRFAVLTTRCPKLRIPELQLSILLFYLRTTQFSLCISNASILRWEKWKVWHEKTERGLRRNGLMIRGMTQSGIERKLREMCVPAAERKKFFYS